MRIIRFIGRGGSNPGPFLAEDHQDGTATILAGNIPFDVIRTSQRARVGTIIAPIQPRDIICIGRNYKPRGETSEATSDERPQLSPRAKEKPREEDGGSARSHHDDATLEVFLKPPAALQNPHAPIRTPNFGDLDVQLDCEGELAVAIGRETRNVSEADALNHVFGYTIANDITARVFQTASGPPLWMRGKGFDTFCPIGPAIITADEIPDPQSLNIRTIINGETVREGNTRDMIRTIPQIIAALSRHMTLRTGSIILTGAPLLHGGLASRRTTNTSLRIGDRVAVEIERIGVLENVIG